MKRHGALLRCALGGVLPFLLAAGCGLPATVPAVQEPPGAASRGGTRSLLEAEGSPTITIDASSVLGRSNAHVLGTCRNHVAGQFSQRDAKLAAMRQLTPTWGDRKYLYRIGHGITDGRTEYRYMTGYHFEQSWNQHDQYPYDDLRDALSEAQDLGADQIHVVNFGTSNASEAARYVSYLNHAGDANRAKYQAARQDVRLFELGNEIAWTHERGHGAYASDEKVYATRALQFARAMRAASDVPIQIGAVASINSNWLGDGWSGGATTVKNILGIMGKDVDFLIFHGYPSWPMVKSGDLQTILAQNEWNRRELEQEIFPAIQAVRPGVGVANTEFFNNLYNDARHAQGLFGALYNADSVILAMNERLLTSVEFCLSHGTTPDSAFFYNDDPSKTTPIYEFQRLLAQHWGDDAVKATATGLPTRKEVGAAAQLDMPLLSFTAARTGSKIYLMVLNRTNDTDVTCRIHADASQYTAYSLGGGWDATTATVTSKSGVLAGTYTFPRAAVTIIELTSPAPAPAPSAGTPSATPPPLLPTGLGSTLGL